MRTTAIILSAVLVALCVCVAESPPTIWAQFAVKCSVLDKVKDKAKVQEKAKPFKWKYLNPANADTNAISLWDIAQDFNRNFTNAAGVPYGVLRLSCATMDGGQRIAYYLPDGLFSATNMAAIDAQFQAGGWGRAGLATNSDDIAQLDGWGIYSSVPPDLP